MQPFALLHSSIIIHEIIYLLALLQMFQIILMRFVI